MADSDNIAQPNANLNVVGKEELEETKVALTETTKTVADLSKATGELAQNTEAVAAATKKLKLSPRTLKDTVEAIKKLSPAVGELSESLLKGPKAGAANIAALYYDYESKQIAKQNEELDKQGALNSQPEGAGTVGVQQAWDNAAEAMGKYYAALISAQKDNDPIGTDIKRTKELSEAKIEEEKKLVAVQGQKEEEKLRQSNATQEQVAAVRVHPAGLAAVCSPGNSLAWSADQFQAQGAIKFLPCCYSVVAITPNNETWSNQIVIPFPAAFSFDDRYGARWQAEIEQAMQDLLWQAPHSPCWLNAGDTWNEDDGTCKCNGMGVECPNAGGGNDYYYPHSPFVETRINLPANGGNGQNETAPALPAGITIGYLNPVTNAGGLQPPGMIGYDPGSLNPSGTFTFWGYRLNIENNACFGNCQFPYVDMENLPCVISYTPPPPTPPPAGNTAQGNTGDTTLT